MSHIVLISGSPSTTSKSAALLQYIQQKLKIEKLSTDLFSIRDFPAEDLVLGKYESPSFEPFKKAIEKASGLVVSTPVYKASYTGGLKALLDILPQSALKGKTVLPLASGGSQAHLLAIDYALKPLLSALGATDQLQGVYVVDKELTIDDKGQLVLPADLQERLQSSIQHLIQNVRR